MRVAHKRRSPAWRLIAGPAALAFILMGCRGGGKTPDTPAPTQVAALTATLAPTVPPTTTPVPLAARVNGRPITVEAYQRELARFEAGQAALGRDLNSLGDYHAAVLEDLIDRELIREAATREGVQVSDGDVQAQYDSAVQAAGGEAAFNAWLEASKYTADEYREALRVAMTSQALAAKVVNVPATAEQVHARHILVATEDEAKGLLAQLQAGVDFDTLARNNSRDLSTRLTGGDLGWFPRGGLAAHEVEDAAFNLQPSQISDVVHSDLGYHIVQTLERDPARPLDPATLAARRQQAFTEWLAAERAKAAVEILNQ